MSREQSPIGNDRARSFPQVRLGGLSLSSSSSLGRDYEDTRKPWMSFVLNLWGLFLYGYSILYLNFDSKAILLNKLMDPGIQPFGQWKFLTYYSLIAQFISSALHLTAIFVPRFRFIRDVLFTTAAYPLGGVVVFSFWTIWFSQGREVIFPKSAEAYFPIWLNHVAHTIIVPVNISQTYLTFHRFLKSGYLLSLSLSISYCIFLLFIRWKTGMFVYPFMNQMSMISILIYFMSVLFSGLALYETGYFLTGIFHLRKLRRLTE